MMDWDLLARLSALPGLLERIAAALTPESTRVAGRRGGFSFTEHVWHLADLEREGYGTRITRLLSEDTPVLPDFDGDRVAREREYALADAGLGVRLFVASRAGNVERLRGLSTPTLRRAGTLEPVGPITLAHVPLMMAGHDQAHAAEIAELLDLLGADGDLVAALRAHASAFLPAHPEAPSSRPAAA